VFDLLAVEGTIRDGAAELGAAGAARGAPVESRQVRLVAMFEDGEALSRVICERGLERVVAKRCRDP
jgi:hypothetical protein